MTDQLQSHRSHTDADESTVATAIAETHTDCEPLEPCDACCASARVALRSLAGRLLPAGGTKRTEHEIDWRHRGRPLDNPTMTYEDFAEHQIDNEIAQAAHLGYEPRAIRRRTITTWPDGATFTSAWETR